MSWATNPHSHGWLTVVGVILLLGLVLVACGDDEGATSEAATEPSLVAPPTEGSGPDDTEGAEEAGGAEDTQGAGDTGAPTAPSDNQSTDRSMPYIDDLAGEVLGVIGVASDDSLVVTEMPDEPESVVAQLGLEDTVMLTGNGRWLPPMGDSIEVETDAGNGWTTGLHLGWSGDTTDQTSYVVEELGEIPTAASMEDLGIAVATSFATLNTAPGSYIMMTAAPTSGDLEEVKFDVLWRVKDVTDANPSGWRLHIFATAEGDTFTLKTVEGTVLCGLRRDMWTQQMGIGVTEDGGCA